MEKQIKIIGLTFCTAIMCGCATYLNPKFVYAFEKIAEDVLLEEPTIPESTQIDPKADEVKIE